MIIYNHILKNLALALFFSALPLLANATPQVLVTINNLEVNSDDLDAAMASSPFSTQQTSMDVDDQAALRGDMLRRLVASRLLTLEARRLGLDKTKPYLLEVENFRLGLLYRFYMDKLREHIVIPEDTLAVMKQQYKGDFEGLAAAKAAYIASQYKALKLATLQDMLKRDNSKLHEDRIKDGVKAGTVLFEGKSIRIKYADIVDIKEHPTMPSPDWVKEQLYNRGELLLVAKAAEQEGVNVDDKLNQYQSERLPAVMMEAKTNEWIPDENVLRDWFAKHPEVAIIPQRHHVGQLVVSTRKEAEALRERILKGESLFTLAGEFSIDPVGRKQNGDMGWFVKGRGMPELENAVDKLEVDKLSEVIESKAGFHLLTVLEYQPEKHKSFEDVHDRIRQMVINEKLPTYLGELERRYKVTWNVLKGRDASTSKTTGNQEQ
jgi:peptidyl-prolyl cis-trans isomerase C